MSCRVRLSNQQLAGNNLKSIVGRLRAVEIYHGEFDPGSERTLAARFKHASRTVREVLAPLESGERVSNT